MYNLIQRDENSPKNQDLTEQNKNCENINENRHTNMSNKHPSKNNLLEAKSNRSCSSYGKNYVLKSDFCKSTKFVAYHKKEEHPWLSYYGDMSKELSESKKSFNNGNNNNSEYSLFVTKPNTNMNFFRNQRIKEINVTAYEEEEEDDSEKIIECEEEQYANNFESEFERATFHIQNTINPNQIFNAFNVSKKLPITTQHNSDISNAGNNNNYMFLNYQNFYPQTQNNTSSFYNQIPFNNFQPQFPQQKPLIQNYTSYNEEALAQLSPLIIKEQNGCRFIQDKVTSDRIFANKILFPYLTKDLPELICDQFGNYLFQVLIGVLTKENLEAMFNIILPLFRNSCVSPHGTRVVQKLIDRIIMNPPLLEQFNLALAKDLVSIAKDPYGNHVIQKYLTVVFYPQNSVIIDIIIENILEITNSKHGCCVTQKCISEGNEVQKKKMLSVIEENLFDIITNQFGNFAVQYILTTSALTTQCENEVMALVRLIGENILYFGKQKFSANVLEKCFENSSTRIQIYFANEIIKDESIVEDLLLDPYGNYVIQKSLIALKNENYYKMLRIIANNTNKIKKKNFGNKLIVKLLVSHKEFGNIIANSHNKHNSLYEYH